MAELSPKSQEALKKAKKKRVSALNRIGEQMMAQATREHKDLMEAGGRQHQELITEMRTAREEFLEEMRAARAEERRSREEKNELMRAALTTLSDIARAFMWPRQEVGRPHLPSPPPSPVCKETAMPVFCPDPQEDPDVKIVTVLCDEQGSTEVPETEQEILLTSTQNPTTQEGTPNSLPVNRARRVGKKRIIFSP